MKKLSKTNQRTACVITHVDGFTKVKATAHLLPDRVSLEYRFDGMDYTSEISHDEAVSRGILEECLHSQESREYIGQNTLRCKKCGAEFS